MILPEPAAPSPVERLRLSIGRASFAAILIGLAGGLLLLAAAQRDTARDVFIAVIAVLATLPVMNVVAIVAEEVRRRDWTFVVVALGVLGLLVSSVVRSLP
jgi:hypothetical protein